VYIYKFSTNNQENNLKYKKKMKKLFKLLVGYLAVAKTYVYSTDLE